MSDYNINKKSLKNKENLKKKSLHSKSPILIENDFAVKKNLSLDIIEKYQWFNKNKAQDMIDCGRILDFNSQVHLGDLSTRLKLEQMYTCKDRFCPFCTWRKARKLAIQSYAVLEAIQALENVRYLFLTLTIKNPDTADLNSEVKKMMQGFNKLFKYKRIQKSTLGHLRALEVHPQKDNPSKSHPHFHVLLIVPAKYFQVQSPLYIPQKEWQSLWKKAMKLDYNPSVDIRAIKPKKGSDDALAAVVAETCKYPVKSTDLSALTQDLFETFVTQMKGTRNLGYGGIFKEYRKSLMLDDVEDGDLIHDITEKQDALWVTVEKLRYQFMNGSLGLTYYLKELLPVNSNEEHE